MEVAEMLGMREVAGSSLLVACLIVAGCDRQTPSLPANANAAAKGLPSRSAFLDALFERSGGAALDELSPDPAQLGPGWTKDDLLVRLFASGGGSAGWEEERWVRAVTVNRTFAADAERARFLQRLLAELRRLAAERGCEIQGAKELGDAPPAGFRLLYACQGVSGSIQVSVRHPNPADQTVHAVTVVVAEPPKGD
jgi:hypothetical protein